MPVRRRIVISCFLLVINPVRSLLIYFFYSIVFVLSFPISFILLSQIFIGLPFLVLPPLLASVTFVVLQFRFVRIIRPKQFSCLLSTLLAIASCFTTCLISSCLLLFYLVFPVIFLKLSPFATSSQA